MSSIPYLPTALRQSTMVAHGIIDLLHSQNDCMRTNTYHFYKPNVQTCIKQTLYPYIFKCRKAIILPGTTTRALMPLASIDKLILFLDSYAASTYTNGQLLNSWDGLLDLIIVSYQLHF